MDINLEFDPNAQAAPQSFRDGVQAAANILDAAIFDPITVNIEVGYGEYDLGGPDYTPLTSNYSLGGIENTVGISYPQLRAVLAANESSASGMEAVNALPNTAALNGQSNFSISTGLAKAFGIISPTATAIDGYAGFPTTFTGSGLIDTAVTEELHAMGLLNDGGDLGLFAYISAGNHFLPTGATATTPAYFSVDGGTTSLANYDVAFDDTLFENLPSDPLNVPTSSSSLTTLDLTEISAIGFDDTSTPVLATPNIAPTTTPAGTTASVTAQNVSVAENRPVSALSMIRSATVPSGDSLTSYDFYDTGTGGGHFVFDGLVEPTGQFFSVVDTELSNLSYVGRSTPGTDTIYVAALDTTANAFSPTVSLTATTTLPRPAGDLNGDGKSDILLQRADGTVAAWLMNGLSTAATNLLANPGTSWHAAATGDFTGGNSSGILFQNDNGQVAIWQTNGASLQSSTIVGNPGANWHATATGDFNGDGMDDILFQADDGTIAIWQMNGSSVAATAVVANPGQSWHAIATGDFSGGSDAGIVLQNDNGAVAIWQVNGTALVSSTVVANPGTSWHVVGAGDVNGDGRSDLVLQNTDGSVAVWEMNGSSIAASAVVGDPGPAWHAVAVGDDNGDGKSDIVFHNDDGTVAEWQMNGTAIQASAVVADPGTTWQTIGLGSLHFIDGTQSSGALSGTILADDFVFTTSLAGSHAITGFDPIHDVITLDQGQFGSYAAVQASETTVNGSTVITLGSNDTLTLTGVLPTALSAKNFV